MKLMIKPAAVTAALLAASATLAGSAFAVPSAQSDSGVPVVLPDSALPGGQPRAPEVPSDEEMLLNCSGAQHKSSLTSAQVLQRAMSWADARVSYSMRKCLEQVNANLAEQYGNYRTDCSGMVSMALGLGRSYGTTGLKSMVVNGSGGFKRINERDARPGDIMVANSKDLGQSYGHTWVFRGWKNGKVGDVALAIEEGGGKKYAHATGEYSRNQRAKYTWARHDKVVHHSEDATPSPQPGDGGSQQPSDGNQSFEVWDQVHVFHVTGGGELGHAFDDGKGNVTTWSWGGDANLDKVYGRPSTFEYKGQQHAFVRGVPDKNGVSKLQDRYWDPGTDKVHHSIWSDAVKSDPEAVNFADGQHVWYVNANDELEHRWWNNAKDWGVETWPTPVKVKGKPSFFEWNGQSHIVVRGADDSLQHVWNVPGEGLHHRNWAPAGSLGGDPEAGRYGKDQQQVFYRTKSGELGHLWWFPGLPEPKIDVWHPGVKVVGKPAYFEWEDQQHVFIRSEKNELLHFIWMPALANNPNVPDVDISVWATGVAADPVADNLRRQQHVWYSTDANSMRHLMWSPTKGDDSIWRVH